MHVFCDESGNTGLDLLNAVQPIFSLASTVLDASACAALAAPLLRQGQKEAKYSRLKGTARGQEALLRFFSSDQLSPETTKLLMADKLYYVLTHLVDKLIEPPLHEAGIDLYARDGHVGLVNVWYYAGPRMIPEKAWKRLLQAFVTALRQRSSASFLACDAAILEVASVVREEFRDFATGLRLAAGRLDEFIGVFDDAEVFDPAVDLFIDTMNKWMAQDAGMFDVTHDRSKPLKRSETFLRTMMRPLPTRLIGYGQRKAELPLRVRNFDFGDSVLMPQLQVADLVAGAAVDCLLAWSGRRESTAYHEAMKRTRLEQLLVGGMLPSPKIEPGAEPGPGEVNLVDGSTTFLDEAGYFRRD